MSEPPANRTIINADVLEGLSRIPDDSIDCVITSPPYYQVRVYHGADAAAQWGTEQTPRQYLDKIAALLSEVKRVLKPTGTCWFNVGDIYSSGPNAKPDPPHAPTPRARFPQRPPHVHHIARRTLRRHAPANEGTRRQRPVLRPAPLARVPLVRRPRQVAHGHAAPHSDRGYRFRLDLPQRHNLAQVIGRAVRPPRTG